MVISFKDESAVFAAERFPEEMSVSGIVARLSSLCDGLGTVAGNASPDTAAYASQALRCIFAGSLASRMTGLFHCIQWD